MIPVANAPRRQPCDKCGHWAKRYSRTDTQARYYCTRCSHQMIFSIRKSPRNLAMLERLRRQRSCAQAKAIAKTQSRPIAKAPRRPSWWRRLVTYFVNMRLTKGGTGG